jgi:hypothetical protein
MAKITEYGIISEESTEGLVNQVTKYIAKGWQPVGGAVSCGSGFLQTLVRSPQDNPALKRVE